MTGRGHRRSVERCIRSYPYNPGYTMQANLQASCKNSLDFVQRLGLTNTFQVHNGCVNTVNWNASGTHIVSGSDDNFIVITEAKSGRIAAKTRTLHKRHIFSARFMPHCNDQAVISCSGEGIVMHNEFLQPFRPSYRAEDALVGDEGRIGSFFDCHAFGSTYDVLPLPDSPRTFLSCGEDGTVRCVDLRVSSRCAESVCDKHLLITAPYAVTAMDVAPVSHYKVAIGCSDSIVRLYDRRMLPSDTERDRITWPMCAYPIPMKYTRRRYRPTCVKFSADENDLLVSYSMENIYLFDLNHPGHIDAELLKSGCYTPKLRRDDDPEPQMPRLRFRGDWSDTGPNSMTSAEVGLNRHNVGQARPPLEPGVLSRLSDEIFRMLNSQTRPPRVFNPSGSSGSSTSTRTSSHMSWQDAVLRTLDSQSEASTSRNNGFLSRFRNAANTHSESTQTGRSTRTGRSTNDAASQTEPAPSSTTGTNTRNKRYNTGDTSGGKFPLNSFEYVKMVFRGHRNSRTMVKGACFWGDDFIMSGSDCGHIFVWSRHTGKVVKTMLADHRVVNRVQPHPTMPYLLSSGIDYNVKLWAPISPSPTFEEEEAESLIKSNEIMLVETRDTITVPAQIMIRILASLNQYRRLTHSSGTATSFVHRHQRVGVVRSEMLSGIGGGGRGRGNAIAPAVAPAVASAAVTAVAVATPTVADGVQTDNAAAAAAAAAVVGGGRGDNNNFDDGNNNNINNNNYTNSNNSNAI